MNTDFENHFARGRWLEWLREFALGEQQTNTVEPKQLASIRVTIARMQKTENYYFTTATEGKELWVKRISFEEWMARPRRRIS